MGKKIEFIYKIEAIDVLLQENAILTGYYPLIPFKTILIDKLKKNGINTNYDCLKTNAKNIIFECLKKEELAMLFKRFLFMYEIEESKLAAINNLNISDDEKESYRKLFLLPGVKETRANLYYLSGFKNLKDIAGSNLDEIANKMQEAINKYKLDYKVALPKEIKTHISVAKAYAIYSDF